MDDEIYKIALAGLLHDVGKFMQRADLEKEFCEIKNNYDEFCPVVDGSWHGYLHAAHTAYFIEKLIPENILSDRDKAELYNGARHHKNPSEDIYRQADILSSGMERYAEEKDPEGYKQVLLYSIFDAIELQYAIYDEDHHLNSRWRYRRAALSGRNPDVLYPVMEDSLNDMADSGLTYRELWKKFKGELDGIGLHKNIKAYFNALYWLLEKYTWCIPSATNVFPDIPLFDHLKTTASIATCLYYTKDNSGKRPDFILYAGDISGIQDYIFKISRVEEVDGISKRLRGRSFFIAMLAEVISRYVVEELDLTIANINYCGGGNIEILLPNTDRTTEFMSTFSDEINKWLIKEFHGVLGYVDAKVEMTRQELLKEGYNKKKDELSEMLQASKLKRNYSQLNDDCFWADKEISKGRVSVCRVCNMNLVGQSERECALCHQDVEVGRFLPKTAYMLFSQDDIETSNGIKSIKFGKFGVVSLLGKDVDPTKFSDSGQAVYSLSEDVTGFTARYFLSQTLPVAKVDFGPLETEKDDSSDGMVHGGQTLSFSTLADMAAGDKRIGILKIDVDRLGQIISMGLADNLVSISRLSTLSRQLSFFFSVHIDSLCRQVTVEWQNDEDNKWPHKMDISSIFYLIFSGGDDLAIVGPWDRIIALSQKIQKSFKDFTCHNPNITLSAGIYICKPKFPIGMAMEKAEEALEQSKRKGKNRITVMGETAVWDKEDACSRVYQEALKNRYPGKVFDENEIHSEEIYMPGGSPKVRIPVLTFNELSHFAREIEGLYDAKLISRQFIYMLIKAKTNFFRTVYNDEKNRFEELQNLMFLPYLCYQVERNTSMDAGQELKKKLITSGDAQKYTRQAYYPCKSVLMKTRKN